MSVKQMGMVWEHEFDRAEQAVMLALTDHADHDGGSIYPSMAKVAWKTGYSRRQVIRVVSRLRKKGILVMVQKADPVRYTPTKYRIDWTKADLKEPFRIASDTMSLGSSDMVSPDDTSVTRLVTPRHRTSDKATSPRTIIQPSIQPSIVDENENEPELVTLFRELTGFTPPHFSTDAYQDKWLRPCQSMSDMGDGAARMKAALQILRDGDYRVTSPQSLVKTAYNWNPSSNGDAWAHVEALVKAGTPPEPDDPVYGAVKRVGWGKLKQMTDYDAQKLRKQFEAVMA